VSVVAVGVLGLAAWGVVSRATMVIGWLQCVQFRMVVVCGCGAELVGCWLMPVVVSVICGRRRRLKAVFLHRIVQ
jgi:hypothetical protein